MRYVKAIRVAPEDSEKIQNILGMTAKERKDYPPEDITYAICFPNHVEFSIQLHYERKRKYFVEACFFYKRKQVYASKQKYKFFENWCFQLDGDMYVVVVC
mgnify:FL=1